MAQSTDKRMFIAVSSLATPDAHALSDHEREKKPIGRRYRSIPSYAESLLHRSNIRVEAQFSSTEADEASELSANSCQEIVDS
jgi:hypothetical protein